MKIINQVEWDKKCENTEKAILMDFNTFLAPQKLLFGLSNGNTI